MKNFVKEGQKLPLYGVGPYIVYGMAALTILWIVLFCYLLKIGGLAAPWNTVIRAVGAVLIMIGAFVWYIGALGSGMDDNIADNKLKTDGIYAWVRNPMYSGWWFVITGISLMWANATLLAVIPLNWLIMTISLQRTEEKWLLDLYGQDYANYKKRVNRCIPWPPKKN